MSATMRDYLSRDNKTIEDYVNGTLDFGRCNSSIINICLNNGVMGRSDQLKLREIYTGLYDAVEKFLNTKNHGRIFIYKEEGKPDVVNMFCLGDAIDTYGTYAERRNAIKTLKRYLREDIIRDYNFIYVNGKDNKHRKLIVDVLKWNMNWSTTFYDVKTERDEPNGEPTTGNTF